MNFKGNKNLYLMKFMTFTILFCTILALNLPHASSLYWYDGTCILHKGTTSKDCVKKEECIIPYRNPACLKISGSAYYNYKVFGFF